MSEETRDLILSVGVVALSVWAYLYLIVLAVYIYSLR